MTRFPEKLLEMEKQLLQAAREQDRFDLATTCLIAPASPTPKKYTEILLRHNAIAEGLVGNRLYAGVEGFNQIEQIAAQAACLLFGADHAIVQPHSVSQANQAVYQALLEPGDSVLAMKMTAGGHLTHGLKSNFSGKTYNFHFYGTSENGFLDYNVIEEKARQFRPKLIVAGGSAYPRIIHFDQLGQISRAVGAHLMADLSHPAGLIIANRFPQPFPHCDAVTITLDKTMLGPHGGIILCKKDLAEKIDRAVHPGVQSSVPLRRIFEMALCLIDAGKPEFAHYINRVIANMKEFEREFSNYPNLMVTGGSDTHLMVVNTNETFGLTGKDTEALLEDKLGVLTNRQAVPNDPLGFQVTSGIRLGTSWITARGYSEEEAREVARHVLTSLKTPEDEDSHSRSRISLEQLLRIPRPNDVWAEELEWLKEIESK